MASKRDSLIAALEVAARVGGEGHPILISPLFWSDMRWDMLGKDADLTQETQREVLTTGHVGTWRGHKLYLDLTAKKPMAKKGTLI